MQQFLQSLAAACARRSYSMVTVVPDGDPRDEMRRLIAGRSVDAFLLSELEQQDPRVMLLAEAGMPYACFGRTGPALPQQWVDIDNRAATTSAVEHVLARGFGRRRLPGLPDTVTGIPNGPPGSRTGWSPAASPPTRRTCCLWTTPAPAGKSGRCWPPQRPELRPDAIVTSSDRLAGVIYSVAAELRLRIGQDLAVTGFDGSAAAALMHPRLTSVAIPVDDIARRVVARALKHVDHGPDQDPGEVVPARLRLGESTGGFGQAAAGEDRTPAAADGGRAGQRNGG